MKKTRDGKSRQTVPLTLCARLVPIYNLVFLQFFSDRDTSPDTSEVVRNSAVGSYPINICRTRREQVEFITSSRTRAGILKQK
jgi:hypothetical protein